MVEWDPIMGAVPPLSYGEWLEAFSKYQQFPEYRQVNTGMSLAEFKQIFLVEYAHRILGRLIGLVFLLPFLFFLFARKIERGLLPKLVALFILGALQGLLGWYMVKSGLVNVPHVSQYRLTAHLGLAFLIYAYMFWVALDLLFPKTGGHANLAGSGLRRWSYLVTGMIFVTVLSGGFVAGLKAGFAYNTFPLMDGHWIPQVMFMQEPLWRNFFENIATVQFDHRLLAMLVFVSVMLFWLLSLRQSFPRHVRIGVHLLVAAVLVQVALGISTLLLHVPVALAATHQAGALLLLTVVLFINQRLVHKAESGQ